VTTELAIGNTDAPKYLVPEQLVDVTKNVNVSARRAGRSWLLAVLVRPALQRFGRKAVSQRASRGLWRRGKLRN